MLKISWKDKVSNTNVLKRIREKEPQFCRETVRSRLAYAGHVLRGSGGRNALVKEKLRAKKQKVDRRECGWRHQAIYNGQCKKDYGEVKRSAEMSVGDVLFSTADDSNDTDDWSCVDLRVGSSKSTWVDLDLPSGVKSVCSVVTIEIFWRRRSHCKSFQVDLMRQMLQRNRLCGNITVRCIDGGRLGVILASSRVTFLYRSDSQV